MPNPLPPCQKNQQMPIPPPPCQKKIEIGLLPPLGGWHHTWTAPNHHQKCHSECMLCGEGGHFLEDRPIHFYSFMLQIIPKIIAEVGFAEFQNSTLCPPLITINCCPRELLQAKGYIWKYIPPLVLIRIQDRQSFGGMQFLTGIFFHIFNIY